MKILVTGGAGFLGVHLCERLLQYGHDVVCMDDFSTSWSHSDIDRLSKNKRFSFIHHDVQYPYDICCDRLYNLACPASPAHYRRDPVRTMKVSFLGTLHALQNADKYGSRVLIASTSEIYGDPTVDPQPETYFGNVNSVGDRSCYDEGKRSSESLSYGWSQKHGTDIRIARIFNTYGPGMSSRDGRLVSNIISQALKNQNVTIYGDGQQTRSFCYVEDTIRGLELLMETDNIGSLPVCNIGNPDERSVMSVARMIIELIQSKSQIIHEPLPQDDPRQRRPDISRAMSLLSWFPQIGLYEGLNYTIDWFKGNS